MKKTKLTAVEKSRRYQIRNSNLGLWTLCPLKASETSKYYCEKHRLLKNKYIRLRSKKL